VDEFQFGTPARARRPQVKVNPRLVWGAVALVVVGALVFAYLTFIAGSGKEVAQTQATVVHQVANAQDLQAQADLRSALSAADTASIDAGTSWAQSKAAQLSILDQGDQYVDSPAPSTGPNVISVQAGQSSWSAAARSTDGTCWWIARGLAQSSGGSGVSTTTYGHSAAGSPCTGASAAAATGASW
jgi:hypothetical protein